jgi:hypothetical protein
MATAEPSSGRRRTVQVVLIVATVLYAVSLLPWAAVAMMSPMAFDAGYSREAAFLVSCLLAYPVLVLIALVGGWICYAKRKHTAAIVFFLLPLADVLVLVGAFLI